MGKVPVEELACPSVEKAEVLAIVPEGEPTWTTPLKYLRHGELPADHAETKRLKYQASRYTLQGDTLY